MENELTPVVEREYQERRPKYPRSVFFIISNEFCERFSYYGAKAILVLYFRNVLLYSENSATEYYHIFAMACYFTPVLGAIIADSLLGKYRTILYISILYAIGNIVLSYASYLTNAAVTWIGLAAIALGTGGIKPCVSAFGGDQFVEGQERQLQKFFSLFYVSINAGSLLSTFITPILREDIQCFGRLDCFPLAFGVPAALMIVALMLFILGKVITGYVMVPPKKENVVVQVVSCISISLWRKFFKRSSSREHWLDYADDKYDVQTIADIKTVMRILFLYLPLPLFWALFDQQGSRWTLQATKMDGHVVGDWRLKPDQIQVVNPVLIVLFIPVFEYAVYPLLAKINLLTKPLQRMVTGGTLAALSFLVCAFIQLKIESQLPPSLNSNSVHLTIFNGLPANIRITDSPSLPQLKGITIGEYEGRVEENVGLNRLSDFSIVVTFDKEVGVCVKDRSYNISVVSALNPKASVLFITESICEGMFENEIPLNFSNVLVKPEEGGANVGLLFVSNIQLNSPSFILKNEKFKVKVVPIIEQNVRNGQVVGYTKYKELEIHLGGKYELALLNDNDSIPIARNLDLAQGGSYIIVMDINNTTSTKYKLQQMVEPNSVSMLWQIIQYTIITAGEIMFSITGLEFSYSQAPTSMKSVIQAAWLLTVAFGNVVIVIIAAVRIPKQSTEFFFFAGLMAVDMIVFAIMAYFYIPNDQSINDQDSSEVKKLDLDKKRDYGNRNGHNEVGNGNPGFQETE